MAKNAAKKPPPVKPPVQQPAHGAKAAVKGAAVKGAAPPVVHKKPAKIVSRVSQTIWADDDDIDLEDLTFVVPIVISLILLFVFFLRQYIRWTVQCPSSNRLEGKTVVITGKRQFYLFKHAIVINSIRIKGAALLPKYSTSFYG